jgi:nucleotide-binding universal stress UspA family protein
MFKHIIVPLDGSILAEAALPAAAYLAQMLQARVTLLHIIEQNPVATIHGERHLTLALDAESYLTEVSRRAFADNLAVECHVHVEATWNVARAIAAHQRELMSDLVVMCTHGRGGLRRALFGAIAQQVIASGDIPVLLIRPGALPFAFQCTQILAPTDGGLLHAQGMIIARQLAQLTGASLHILAVVPTVQTLSGQYATTRRFMPRTLAIMLDMATDELKTVLQQQLTELQQQGLTVSMEVIRGEPATVIAKVAERLNASLLVLGTHGRSGTTAFWHTSIGAKIISRTRCPLLLVPIKEVHRIS